MLTDARGVPVGVAIDGANVHDQKLVEQTFHGIPVRRPAPRAGRPQHLCADNGYNSEAVRRAGARRGYAVHIPRRGESPRTVHRRNARARRWVVERTHSWINRARRLLIRWEKKAANYLALLHLQFAYTALRAAGVFG